MSLEVLILTGPCAVGKTTTAKAWAKNKNGAIVECDYLTNWIYSDDFPHWTEEEEKFTSKLSSSAESKGRKNEYKLCIIH